MLFNGLGQRGKGIGDMVLQLTSDMCVLEPYRRLRYPHRKGIGHLVSSKKVNKLKNSLPNWWN